MSKTANIRVLIVDDEPLAHDVVLTYINECEGLEVVGQCFSGSEALEFVKSTPVDLIFLDIEMPVLTGFDFISLLTTKPQVIITSAYQNYALEGFNMDVADYLLKPFRFDRFKQAIDKVHSRINSLLQMNTQETKNDDNFRASHIFIKVDKKKVLVSLDQVSRFESYGNYVKVWRGEESLLTPKTLSSFEESLDKKQFVRVHKTVIINIQMIDYFQTDSVTLNNGITVPIGKQYKHNLQ